MDVTLPPEVQAAFDVAGEPYRAFDNGLVNYSFAVGDPPRLVIQGINDRYLSEADAVMENLVRILGHLEWKRAIAERATGQTTPRWYPLVVPTGSGKPYVFDADGTIWRALSYLGATAIGSGAAWATIEQAAYLFGRFVGSLDDLGGPPLRDVTPDFRDMGRVVNDFEQRDTLLPTPPGFDSAVERARALTELLDASSADLAAVPRRVVHNDPKLANCLADASGAAVAVIDFDLAMDGWVMDDFGDLVRSAAHNRDAEHPIDVAERVVEPFLLGAEGVLDQREIDVLHRGPVRVCTQLAWRYLTDVRRAEPMLRVGGPEAAVAKATVNLVVAEQLLEHEDRLAATISRVHTSSKMVNVSAEKGMPDAL